MTTATPYAIIRCRSRHRWLGLQAMLAALLLAPIASAGTIRADRSEQDYLDLGAAYPAVGKVHGQNNEGSFWASGVLISSNWVLTAAHVLEGATEMTYTLDGQTYNVVQGAVHRRWDGNLSMGYDMAVFQIDSNVTDITPAKRYKAKRELGLDSTWVGFGKTGTGITGSTTYDGLKRGEQNVIDTALNTPGQRDRVLLSDFDNPNNAADSHYGSSTPLNLEGLIAPGDSGGGVFVHLRGRDLLVGINSFGAAYDGTVDSDYGDVAGFIRVTVFNTWIDNVIGSPDPSARSDVFQLSGGSAFSFTQPIPEPAGLSLGLLSLCALLPRRRAH